MHRQLQVQRRILFSAYQRYLTSDRALEIARSKALRWFPEAAARKTELIGNPGSRIRYLYERRNRAIARLNLARQALLEARNRGQDRGVDTIYLIGFRDS